MANGIPDYPWFGVIEGDDIEQGDIVENFPVFCHRMISLWIRAANRPARLSNGKSRTLS